MKMRTRPQARTQAITRPRTITSPSKETRTEIIGPAPAGGGLLPIARGWGVEGEAGFRRLGFSLRMPATLAESGAACSGERPRNTKSARVWREGACGQAIAVAFPFTPGDQPVMLI